MLRAVAHATAKDYQSIVEDLRLFELRDKVAELIGEEGFDDL
jgi:hypothetical protein